MKERGGARILVIDDEPRLRELLADAFSGEDFQVTCAASGREAVELARVKGVDLIVTDLLLDDCCGTEVVDRLRSQEGSNIPVVVITGQADPRLLSEATRIRPVELMTKPLDIDRLRRTVREELCRQEQYRLLADRNGRLRRLARKSNQDRKEAIRNLEQAATNLSETCCDLNDRITCQKVLIDYQQDLLGASTDDDVFKVFFRLVVRHSGQVYGVALVCNEETELQVVGRFGVPAPDSSNFCKLLAKPIIDAALVNPHCFMLDVGEERHMFPESIQRYLVGVSALVIPLVPAEGEMIGMVILYRKAEQPFIDEDLSMATMIAPPAARAIARND
jgi:DNA-binding response OmpR family regulator